MKLTSRDVIGIVGSMSLAAGAFAPLLSYPYGSINYVNNGNGDGMFVLLFAVVSLFLIFGNAYKWLYLTSLGSMCLLVFAAYMLNNAIADTSLIVRLLITFSWGWILMILGVVLLVLCAADIFGMSTIQDSNPTILDSQIEVKRLRSLRRLRRVSVPSRRPLHM